MALRFLGIDVSTQSLKGVCINLHKSAVEYTHSIHYDEDLPGYGTRNGVIPSQQISVSESNPNMWIDGLNALFRHMKKTGPDLQSIAAISVSGQQHGLVTLDEAGELTRKRSKLWNDASTDEECRLLTKAIGGQKEMIAEIGNTQRTGYTAGKIFHLYRHEKSAAEKTQTFFLVHNFINWYLTGGKAGGKRVMEPGDVSGMALRHPAKQKWSERICATISDNLTNKLPPVLPADQPIGLISNNLVKAFGFSENCIIDAGCGDNMYSSVGTGNIEPGMVSISLGTSGTAYTILDEPWVDPQGEIALFSDSTGRYMPLLCVSNMANGYVDFLKQKGYTHQSFATILQQTQPGNEGRLLFPWYESERTPDLPHAVPVYWGFKQDDFDDATLARALIEGHVLNLYDGYRRMPVQSSEIRLTGGLSNSDAWCQTIADIFANEVVPVKGEGAAIGAALHAAWVYQKENENTNDLKNLCQQFVQLDEKRRKYPKNHQCYDIPKQVYHEVSMRLRHSYNKDAFSLTHEIR
ncbi:MAG: hypothetical protein GF313_07430 [Caldithrix sp.]|nr:hypothetical protein [Caldithrix sp.]